MKIYCKKCAIFDLVPQIQTKNRSSDMLFFNTE